MYDIKKAAVLGSGVMGCAIAAHLANAGLLVTLLDIVPAALLAEETAAGLSLKDRAVRNRLVNTAREKMTNPRSTLLYEPRYIERIQFGNLDDDLELLRQADWVIEAVIENLAAKTQLFKKIEPFLTDKTVLSSNTSGISVNAMAKELSAERQENFLVTHFFNPPRYMKLIELVAAQSTAEPIFSYMRRYCEDNLGKGVVVAKDTPGFVANRIGIHSFGVVAAKMQEHGLSIEEADALTGGEIGRPNTGTFRLIDMVGLDTTLSVANYQLKNVADPAERAFVALPDFFVQMQQKGYLGDKTKQGFYRKLDKETQVIEVGTLTYRAKTEPDFPSLANVKAAKTLHEKLTLWLAAEDKAGRFVWDVLKQTLLFVGGLIPAVADDPKAIDNGMKWGYNWTVGPFELWDMIGVRKSAERMKREGAMLPPFVEQLLASGREKFYEDADPPADLFKQTAACVRKSRTPVRGNQDASLFDLEDGLACFVIHSPTTSLSEQMIECLHQSIREVETNYRGLVIASAGKNFCVGANLSMIIGLAEAKDWKGLEAVSALFQQANMAVKYCSKPVIAAPFGMTLGGGAELVMHAAGTLAQAETNMGLVEAGVGLLPGAGGNKELFLRLTAGIQHDAAIDLEPFTRKAFMAISGGKVSTSAPDAKRIGYLQESDEMVMNPDLQLFRCRQRVKFLAETMPTRNPNLVCRVSGGGLIACLKAELYNKRRGGFISEHDELIGGKIAHVLCGGTVKTNRLVTEQYLLDLERECFVSLCGEVKTQDRIRHMLKNRKPLRN